MLKLLMSIYGQKQAGRLWNDLLHKHLLNLNFQQCKTDLCLYFKRSQDQLIIVGVYVDDLLVTSTLATMVDQFFEDLKTLDVKDLGVVHKFLKTQMVLALTMRQ